MHNLVDSDTELGAVLDEVGRACGQLETKADNIFSYNNWISDILLGCRLLFGPPFSVRVSVRVPPASCMGAGHCDRLIPGRTKNTVVFSSEQSVMR
jgi:hypothetical protein